MFCFLVYFLDFMELILLVSSSERDGGGACLFFHDLGNHVGPTSSDFRSGCVEFWVTSFVRMEWVPLQ